MATEAGDVAGEARDVKVPTADPVSFSWLQPHVIFVVILVGEEETPFGIQKDFLCAKSTYYRAHFADKQDGNTEDPGLEHVVKLPEATPEVFGFVQNFLYTGKLFTDTNGIPRYEVLIAIWKLGNDLGIEGLCDEALESMAEYRILTQHIPATPLLVQAWKDTPEGSSIRKLLLNWAAEYIRSSGAREEFTKSLPKEVLSELVIAMSDHNPSPAIQVNPSQPQRKNVHYLEAESTDDETVHKARAHPPPKKSRASWPTTKPPKTKRTNINNTAQNYSTEQKLTFCADLLSRMLSGPGFWTRLIGPFRDPVQPERDGVPDYFDKIDTPMDLTTIKEKMDHREYNDEQEFLADVRQIFKNCYTYHKRGSPMWTNCERFEKIFEDKFSTMSKWISKLEGEEAT